MDFFRVELADNDEHLTGIKNIKSTIKFILFELFKSKLYCIFEGEESK